MTSHFRHFRKNRFVYLTIVALCIIAGIRLLTDPTNDVKQHLVYSKRRRWSVQSPVDGLNSCDNDNLQEVLRPPERTFGRFGDSSVSGDTDEGLSMQKVKHIMEARRKHMLGYCKRLNLPKDKNSTETRLNKAKLFIDRKKKFLFCLHGKVGSTIWAAIMGSEAKYINVELNDPEKIDLPTVYKEVRQTFMKRLQKEQGTGRIADTSQFKWQWEWDDVLHNYQSALVVRHPFELLASVYRDKVIDKDYARKYVLKFRGTDTDRFYNTTIPIFEELANYLIYLFGKGLGHDFHWDTFLRQCAPCDIKYNFIGHYETLHDDASYILRKMKAKVKQFPTALNSKEGKAKLSPKNSTASANLVQQYFDPVPLSKIKRLRDIYRHDFVMFNYSFC